MKGAWSQNDALEEHVDERSRAGVMYWNALLTLEGVAIKDVL